MSSTCNYCKTNGHRIYRIGSDGQRVLTCPVLIEKEKLKPKVNAVEEEFPALPGSRIPASEATVSLMHAISCSEKERKQREWRDRQDDRENRQRIWQQKKETKEKEQGLVLYNKYGPTWFFRVRGNPTEDSDYASHLRYEHEEEERRRDDEYGRMQAEYDAFWEAQYEAKQKERVAKRALMSSDEAWEDEYDELDDEWFSFCQRNDYQNYLQVSALQGEKKHYDAMGWHWPPVRG